MSTLPQENEWGKRYSMAEIVPGNWRESLDERQRKELRFAEIYASSFAHGTDGHNRLILIATLAEFLDAVTKGLPIRGDKSGIDITSDKGTYAK